VNASDECRNGQKKEFKIFLIFIFFKKRQNGYQVSHNAISPVGYRQESFGGARRQGIWRVKNFDWLLPIIMTVIFRRETGS
jgi:hypothetical protein